MKKIDKNLMGFIDKTPNAYVCVENLKKLLLDKDFIQVYENNDWSKLKTEGNYFVVKNDSSLIAFKLTGDYNLRDVKNNVGFNIVASHTDSPSFTIKPNADLFDGMYHKLNVNGYGGMINYTWLDRPLSLSGRVVVLADGVYKNKIININRDLLVIPSQAIHINREINSKNELNHQIDLLPLISLTNEKNLENIIRETIEKTGQKVDKICDYDLYLYNRDKSKYIGLDEEMILAPRLDDLACLYPSCESFIEANNNSSINVFCAFNNEEIGSLTGQGADSSFLIDILSRISELININLLSTLKNSFIVSADNAHALHPNAPSKSNLTNKVQLNNGLVIKHHVNYTTDAISSSLFKGICDNAKVPYQDFACRSDMKCGATLGGISQSHVSIDSVDIGLPQLAMHSTLETIGKKDVLYMYKSLLEFYNTTILKERDQIRLLKKN